LSLFTHCPIRALVVCLATVAHANDDATTPTEEEPVVDSASLVQAALLSGPGFSVDPPVELRGYMAHFTQLQPSSSRRKPG
jgi:hypothetical protein